MRSTLENNNHNIYNTIIKILYIIHYSLVVKTLVEEITHSLQSVFTF